MNAHRILRNVSGIRSVTLVLCLGMGVLLGSSPAPAQLLLNEPVEPPQGGNWSANDILWGAGSFITPGVIEGQTGAGMNDSNFQSGSSVADRVWQNFTGTVPPLDDALYTTCFGMGNQTNAGFPSVIQMDFSGISSDDAIAVSTPEPPSGEWRPWALTFDGNVDSGAHLGTGLSWLIAHGDQDALPTNMRFDGMGDFSTLGDGFLVTRYGGSRDQDGDGVLDPFDNCLTVPNWHQVDVNDDGVGNACDRDYNEDQRVDILDFAIFGACFSQAFPGSGPPDDPVCAESDIAASTSGFRDLVVDLYDFAKFGAGFGGSPGVSGLCCANGRDPSGNVIPCEAPAQVYAATSAGLAISGDGGAHWTTVAGGPSGYLLNTNDVLSVDAQANRVVVGTDLGIAISKDSGKSWIPSSQPPDTQIDDVYVAGNFIYVATPSGIYFSIDGGPFVSLYAGPTTSVAVFDQTILAGTYSGGMMVSYNHGGSWQVVEDGIVPGFGSDDVNGVFAGAEHHGWMAATGTGVSALEATTGVPAWTTTPLLGATSVHAERLIVGGSSTSGVWVTDTFGALLHTATNGVNGFAGTNDVRAVYTHRDEVYAATDAGVSISTDQGATWTTSTQPDLPSDDVRDIVYR